MTANRRVSGVSCPTTSKKKRMLKILITVTTLHAVKAHFPWFCQTSVTSNSVTYNADDVQDGVRFRLIGQKEDESRTRRALNDRRGRRLDNIGDCNDDDYDFTSHCKYIISGTSYDFDANTPQSQSKTFCFDNTDSREACLQLCAQTWNDADTSFKCKTVQYRDNNPNENCCYSSVGAFSSSFETLYNSDSHHWCFFASASACFGEPAVSHMDTSQSCAGTANQDQCANFACLAGYTVVSAPTCSSGNWGGGECTQNECSALPSDLGNGVIPGTSGSPCSPGQVLTGGSSCTIKCDSGFDTDAGFYSCPLAGGTASSSLTCTW